MRVIINTCFGGFGFSNKAVERMIELGMTLTTFKDGDYENPGAYFVMKEKDGERSYYTVSNNDRRSLRTDSRAIQVVEELGEEASGDYAELKIIEIPDGIEWEIEEYDGVEHIAEAHQTWS